jgi:GT2 family glycosyltransferase
VIVIAAEEDADAELCQLEHVSVIVGRRGGASQRNDGIDHVAPDIDFITFLDDDVELATDYLRNAREFLLTHDDIAIVTGTLLKDGGVTRDEAKQLVDSASLQPINHDYCARSGVYGNNFTVRRSVAAAVRFDERFCSYSWLEDLDFGKRCEVYGKSVTYAGSIAVHLAVTSGRVSGLRMGFSQVMNSCYVHRKGLISRGEMLRSLWIPALRNNLIMLLLFDRKIDRWGRLRGNLLALWLLAHGRCEPEYVERLR